MNSSLPVLTMARPDKRAVQILDHEMLAVVYDNSEDIEDSTPAVICFKESNPRFYKIFNMLGFIPIYWTGSGYKVSKVKYLMSYILWFLLPMISLAVLFITNNLEALKESTKDDPLKNPIHIYSGALFFAVVIPGLLAYIIRVLTVNLPLLHARMADIDGKLRNHRRPIKFLQIICPCIQRCRERSTSKTTVSYALPLVTAALSTIFFFAMWAYQFFVNMRQLNWTVISTETLFFCLQCIYILMPFCTTWFMSVIIEWFRCSYIALYNMIVKSNSSDEFARVTGLIIQLQTTFDLFNHRMVHYIASVNSVTATVISVFCCMKVFAGVELIFYAIPLFCNCIILWYTYFCPTQLTKQVSCGQSYNEKIFCLKSLKNCCFDDAHDNDVYKTTFVCSHRNRSNITLLLEYAPSMTIINFYCNIITINAAIIMPLHLFHSTVRSWVTSGMTFSKRRTLKELRPSPVPGICWRKLYRS